MTPQIIVSPSQRSLHVSQCKTNDCTIVVIIMVFYIDIVLNATTVSHNYVTHNKLFVLNLLWWLWYFIAGMRQPNETTFYSIVCFGLWFRCYATIISDLLLWISRYYVLYKLLFHFLVIRSTWTYTKHGLLESSRVTVNLVSITKRILIYWNYCKQPN